MPPTTRNRTNYEAGANRLRLRARLQRPAPPLSETSVALRETIQRLERELEDARTRYRDVVECLLDMVLTLTSDGRITAATGNTMGILGIPPQDLSTASIEQLAGYVHPDDVPLFYERVWQLIGTESAGQCGVRVRDIAGEHRNVEIRFNPIYDQDCVFRGQRLLLKDVTDRVRSAAVVASLARAAEAVQSASLSPDGVLSAVTEQLSGLGYGSLVLVAEGDGEALRVAAYHDRYGAVEAFGALSGSPAQGTLVRVTPGGRLQEILVTRKPVRMPASQETIAELLPGAGAAHAPVVARLLEGCELVLAPMAIGGRIVGLLITANREADAAAISAITAFANQTAIALSNAQLVQRLRDSEEQYRRIFESVTDGLTIFDAQGTILEANPAACHLYGYTREELVGMHLSKIVHPDHYHGLENLKRSLAEQGWFRAQALNVRRDRTLVEVEVHATEIQYRGRRQILSVDVDVTDRMQTQRALLRSEKLRALGQMAGGIAHDYNNLLASIRGCVSLALLELDDNPAMARDDLARAIAGTSQAAEAVRRLQALYRQSDDKSDLTPVHVDGVVRGALELTQPRWKDQPQYAGHTIHVVTMLGDPPLVMGNSSELGRVVSNLVLNAVDAMSDGGTLTLRTGCEAGWTTISVQDTGCGIPEAQQPHVFEPFFSTKGASGSGLGLTMSQTIVQRHGGALLLESVEGEGSTFTVRLPISSRQTLEVVSDQATDAIPREGRPSTRPLKVLVVDDDCAVLHTLVRMLQRGHHTVQATTSGEEAMEYLGREAFDLLITDLGMPDVPGHQVVTRAQQLQPQIPVVLATGWSETISPEQLARLGATTLLAKPFTADDLYRAVETALS